MMKITRITFNQNKKVDNQQFSGSSNEKTKTEIVKEWLKYQDEKRALPQKMDTFFEENKIICDQLEGLHRGNVIAEIFNNSKEQLKTLAQKYKIRIKLSDDLPIYTQSLPSRVVDYEEKLLKIEIKDIANKKIKPYTTTVPMVKTFVLHKMIKDMSGLNLSDMNFSSWLKIQEKNFLKYREEQLKKPQSFLKRLFGKI